MSVLGIDGNNGVNVYGRPEPSEQNTIESEYKKRLQAFEHYIGNLKDAAEGKRFAAIDSHFDAASYQIESLQNFSPASQPADDDLSEFERATIIPRCRETYNNDLIGKAAVNRIIDGSIGVNGLTAKSVIDHEVTGHNVEDAEKLQRFFNRRWRRWSKAKNCDIAQQRTFTELLKTIQLSKLVDGDLLVNTVSLKHTAADEFFLKLQLIEGERLSNEGQAPDLPVAEGRNGLTQGIEHDRFGRHIAYWIREAHPGEKTDVSNIFVWRRLPAFGDKSGKKRVFFISPFGRIDQKRGVPYLAVALDKLRTIKQYSRHELFAAAITALYTVFVKNINPSEDSLHNQNNNKTVNPFEDEKNCQLGAGTVAYLKDNQDVAFADPTRPNSVYEAFLMTQLKEVGAGLGLPFEYLILVFNTSYTAARASFLQADQTIEVNRNDLIFDLLIHLWELLLDETLEVGEIPEDVEQLIDFDRWENDADYREALGGVTFAGSKLGSIDELKDVQAAGLRVDKGFSDYDTEIKKIHGSSDFETVTGRLAQQVKTRRESGLAELATPGVTVAKTAIPSPDDVIDQLEEGQEEKEEPTESGGEVKLTRLLKDFARAVLRLN